MEYTWNVESLKAEKKEAQELLPVFLKKWKDTQDEIDELNYLNLEHTIEKYDAMIEIKNANNSSNSSVVDNAFPYFLSEEDGKQNYRDLMKHFYSGFTRIPVEYFELWLSVFPILWDIDISDTPIQEGVHLDCEEMIQTLFEILKESGNKEIISRYDQIITTKPSLINFESMDKKLEIYNSTILGLTMPIPFKNKNYANLYVTDTDKDLFNFAHEMFHMIFSNPQVDIQYDNHFFYELEGAFAERIVGEYYKKHGKGQYNINNLARQNFDTLQYLSDLFVGNLLFTSSRRKKFRIPKVIEIIKRIGFDTNLTIDDVEDICSIPLIHLVSQVGSHFGALDFFNFYLQDSEKSLDYLFRLKKDKAPLYDLLDKYPFTFHEDNCQSGRNELIELNKQLAKRK